MRSPCLSSVMFALAGLAAVSCENERSAAPPAVAEVKAEAAPEPLPAPTLTIAVYDSPGSSAPQTQFSIARTRDLHICSTWSALEGEHFETRQFYAPSGELYYQKLIPFSTDIDEPYPFTHPVSIPHATMMQAVVPNERAELVVCDQLAVAGAWIGDHQLTGAWRLDVSLDGAKSSAGSYRFEITR